MAYVNYEGKVFRNGLHFHEGCGGQVRISRNNGDFYDYPFHALLGQGAVRVGLRKCYPAILIEGTDGVFDATYLEGLVEEAGYRCYAFSVGNHASATLIEPDGTVWVGMSGYEPYESWCEEDE